MKQYYTIISIFLLFLLFNTGCGNSPETNGDNTNDAAQLILLTQKQIDSEGIEFGEITKHVFEERVLCNGYIKAPANGIAKVSTPISGKVESINCVLGDFVRKGQVLCRLSSNEFMILQRDFAETSVILGRLKADYKRSKTLYNEKIGAEKDFRAIESDFKAMTTKYMALKIWLETLKLNVSKIENGDLYSTFPVVAPIKGYVTDLDLILGQFTMQEKDLVEIVNIDKLQLQLSVYEDDISKLKPGQLVQFKSLGEQELSHAATLVSIGKAISIDSRTIQCIANISNEVGKDFMNRSYVEASLIVNQSEANALPDEAILKSVEGNYVFVVDKSDGETSYLRKVFVTIGRNSNAYSEIITGEFNGKILIKGVYNLQTE
jgi:membrane fusion protein, heavy metal efflux system